MPSYLNLPGEAGDYAGTPDSAALSITGDIDLRVRVAMDDWTPTGGAALVAKYHTGSNQASYFLLLTSAGQLRFRWTTDGNEGSSLEDKTASTTVGFTDGTIHWVRVTLDVDNGSSNYDCKFWTSDDGVSWSQSGTTQNGSGTTSIFDGTYEVQVGAQVVQQPLAGQVYRVRILDGIDGTIEFDADFTAEAPGTTSFAESSANAATVTINQSGSPQAEILADLSIGTLTFDRTTNGIQVNAPLTVITIQELVNFIREYEDEWESMGFSSLITGAGKDALGGGVFVGITMTLLDPWEIFFEARLGPDVVECFVRGGNLVATDVFGSARPAMRESPFTFAVIEQSTSASLIEETAGLTLTQFIALKDS